MSCSRRRKFGVKVSPSRLSVSPSQNNQCERGLLGPLDSLLLVGAGRVATTVVVLALVVVAGARGHA